MNKRKYKKSITKKYYESGVMLYALQLTFENIKVLYNHLVYDYQQQAKVIDGLRMRINELEVNQKINQDPFMSIPKEWVK